jgi:hypothetical protein
MFPTCLNLLTEVYSCTRGLFWRKCSLSDCPFSYFSDLKWVREHFEAAVQKCDQKKSLQVLLFECQTHWNFNALDIYNIGHVSAGHCDSRPMQKEQCCGNSAQWSTWNTGLTWKSKELFVGTESVDSWHSPTAHLHVGGAMLLNDNVQMYMMQQA